MTEEQNVNSENGLANAPEMEFRSTPDAQAAAEAALGDIRSRSFSSRHPELGKMVNCQVCNRRHRVNDPVLSGPCKQQFKQMWVDEDVETGELTIQYATVPLPGQNATPKAILGAKAFAKKRKTPRPNHKGLQIVELTRRIYPTINREVFTTDVMAMMEAKRIAINSFNKKREREAKRIRKQQHESRRINRREQ